MPADSAASGAIPGSGWIGALFVLLGAILDGIGISCYVNFHRAFIRNQPTPTGVVAVLSIAVAVTTLGALLGAFVILSLHQ